MLAIKSGLEQNARTITVQLTDRRLNIKFTLFQLSDTMNILPATKKTNFQNPHT